MQREKRYIVLKCSDVDAAASHGFLSHYQMDSLVAITSELRSTSDAEPSDAAFDDPAAFDATGDVDRSRSWTDGVAASHAGRSPDTAASAGTLPSAGWPTRSSASPPTFSRMPVKVS